MSVVAQFLLIHGVLLIIIIHVFVQMYDDPAANGTQWLDANTEVNSYK